MDLNSQKSRLTKYRAGGEGEKRQEGNRERRRWTRGQTGFFWSKTCLSLHIPSPPLQKTNGRKMSRPSANVLQCNKKWLENTVISKKRRKKQPRISGGSGQALHTNGRGRTSEIIQHLEMSERQHGWDNRQQEGWQTYSWSCGSGNTQGHSHHGNFVWKGNNFVSSLPWGRAGWIIKNTRKLFFFGALHQGPKIAESEDTKSKA